MGDEATPDAFDSPPPADPRDPWIGSSLASYVILEQIGHGGMGVVYLARHNSLGRLAAIKFLASNLAEDAAFVEMFLREAKSAANLNHPNIVAVYDAGADGDVYYFIMEYVRGQDLSLIQQVCGGALPVRDAIEYVRQAASALAYAHRKNIIHRDIKPENLMRTEDGTIKVGDLGLAKWAGDSDSAMTQAGLVVGSPNYISPERLRDTQCNDPRSDIYSLGATLFHLVTGKLPYDGTPPVIMSAHLHDPVPDPAEARPELDEDLCDLIKDMMAKKLEERFQTMDEVESALIAYQIKHYGTSPAYRADTRSQTAISAGITRPLRRGRKSKLPVLVGGVALALALVGALGYVLAKRAPSAKTAASIPGSTQPAAAPAVKRVPAASLPKPSGPLIADFNLKNPYTATLDLIARASYPPDAPATCTTQIVRGAGPDQSDAWQTLFDISKPGSYCTATLDPGERDVAGYDAVTFKIRSEPSSNIPVTLQVMLYTRKDSDENASFQRITGLDSEWRTVTIPLTSKLPLQAIGLSFQNEWGGAPTGEVFVDDIVFEKKNQP